MHDQSQAWAAIREVVGPQGWTDRRDEMQAYLHEWRSRFHGSASLLVRPKTTAEVAAVLALCHEHHIGVVPQGANTGLCGGAIPSGDQLLLSLERMNRILDVDAGAYTLTAEAGCVLADVQAAARAANRLFALSLAAGRCQLGGCVSTNAGGTNVLRYGTAREQVLGLEVVLPDGRVLDTLRALRKDSSGYDLKQWFIGAEGTLGVVTKVCCRLYPLPRARETALAAVDDPATALALLAHLRERLGDSLTAFEMWPRHGMELVLRHMDGGAEPLPRIHPWYVLVEQARFDVGHGTALAQELGATRDAGRIRDFAMADDDARRERLWHLRIGLSEAQKREGPSIKHDVSVPLTAMARFIEQGCERVERMLPGARVLAFGHVGDGNVHFNVGPPPGMPDADFLARWEEVAARVHDLAVELGGSFSAEHGVGQLKVGELQRLRSPLELELMRALKRQLDPRGIMNPGKLLAAEPAGEGVAPAVRTLEHETPSS